MKIAEIFHSLQGEGRLTGTPSVFVRTSGCNLRCAWCDSPYTSWHPEGEIMAVEQIVAGVRSHECGHVVITGGEPMIAPEIGELTGRLKASGLHITIETAGTVFADVTCDLASVSPKLSNSTPDARTHATAARMHESRRINLDVVQRFVDEFDHQLKFVIANAADVQECERLLERLRGIRPENVHLMPEGVDAAVLTERSAWLAKVCLDRGFRFCPRLHIMLFGNTRGT